MRVEFVAGQQAKCTWFAFLLPAGAPRMSGGSVYHPAAEIVAIALRKICKVANSRKYAQLQEEAKLFLDELHLIIPAAGTAGGSRLLIYGKGAGASTADLPGLGGGTQSAPRSQRGSVDGRADSAHAPAPEEAAPGTPRAAQAAEGTAAGGAAAADQPTDPTAPAPGPQSARPSAGGSEPAPAPETPTAQEPPPPPQHPPHPGQDAAAGSSAPAAAAPPPPSGPSATSRTATAPSTPPPELDLPEMVPRTDSALPDPVCDRIVGIFRLAVETQRPEVIEVAVDCLQKLIAFRFMQVGAWGRGWPMGWDGQMGARQRDGAHKNR